MEKRYTKGKYVLNDQHHVVACYELFEWARWMQDNDLRVDYTELPGEIIVSTLFLGMDHNWTHSINDELEVFETMAYSKNKIRVIVRTATWDEAVATHKKMVELHTIN